MYCTYQGPHCSFLPHPCHHPFRSTSPTLKLFANIPSSPLESCGANNLWGASTKSSHPDVLDGVVCSGGEASQSIEVSSWMISCSNE